MKFIFKSLVLLSFLAILSGCGHDQLDIDTSSVQIEPVVFKRLDKDIFSLTEENVNRKSLEFQKKYTTFYNRYISSIVNNGGIHDSLYSSEILHFVQDKDMNAAYVSETKI